MVINKKLDKNTRHLKNDVTEKKIDVEKRISQIINSYISDKNYNYTILHTVLYSAMFIAFVVLIIVSL